MTTRLSRRQFLSRGTAVAGGALLAPALLRSETKKQQLHVACVGVNGMGFADLSNIGSHPAVKFVGFCDVDSDRFDRADEAFPGVPHFADYREMLAELGDTVDAVSVSTPDHMHAHAALAALEQGNHVYCQKPLTRTVEEARRLQVAAEEAGVTTQMGNQIHSHVAYRLGTRLIREGVIGKVKEVHSWVGVSGRQHSGATERPDPAEVPSNLDWDLWIGGAPMRPYAPKVYHPFTWRDWQDFGSGALGDFGCHIFDPVFTALELTAPVTVKAEHDGTNDEVWPGPETVTYVFPGTEYTAGDQITVIWRDGGLKPPRDLAQLPDGEELPGGGSLFIGEEGNLVLPHVDMPKLYPVEKFADFTPPEESNLNHWHVWVDAVLAGERTSDGFHYAGPLTEAVQLGNVAALVRGRELEWDAAGLRVPNNSEADALLRREYREGWELGSA
ncbi:MAG: gfo/Idh/MocA family oxidoreductase [Planctomycetota bacterium]|nr:MAG: gfo/Idh/MocA family oxidoreductase [Planctomycetota bacterium]REJ87380.1 MAG: gfo/Idh/MocA family oxidoreductase [Planctomycetota bacterium]REK27319.1 MAG: gfo/Idh/MocA family oxidoreductase [Planctomycetota bacterium]REK36660.1 MAG: gfo/Idh/MocA family oxidoreductase [Planctomycetota bacterium]